jgi:hypothetical protein
MVFWTLGMVVVTYLGATTFHVHETPVTRAADYYSAITVWALLCAVGAIKYVQATWCTEYHWLIGCLQGV